MAMLLAFSMLRLLSLEGLFGVAAACILFSSSRLASKASTAIRRIAEAAALIGTISLVIGIALATKSLPVIVRQVSQQCIDLTSAGAARANAHFTLQNTLDAIPF